MATLNSRCSVLAAANPKFGRFDRYKILAEQIDLPAPIISRFDLIFVIEDKPSREKDSELAAHILEMHKENTVDYEIEPELLRKYIAYARKNVNPRLTDEANEILREFYVSTRNSNPEEQGAVPITARQLEATIRLAEASAKIKLKDKVEREDADKAVKLTMFCLKDVGVDPETGEIDADIVSGGTPKSDRDKIQRVTEEIKKLEEEYAGSAPMNVLISKMSDDYGVSPEKTEEIVRKLVQKGAIYEPQTGHYKSLL
jgi:replicative DNA helicase Mcm